MAKKKLKTNPSIPSEHIPTDDHFTDDGRKLVEMEHVGAKAPDADPEDVNHRRGRRRTSRL